MVLQDSLLVIFIQLTDGLPMFVLPSNQGRGHPKFYSDRLLSKALMNMIVHLLQTVHNLLPLLAQPAAEMTMLRQMLMGQESSPSRRTWERRLKAIPDTLLAQIGCLGRHLVSLIQLCLTSGRTVATSSTILCSRGGKWHHKFRYQGAVPHTSIDTEAHWTKLYWHGWELYVVSVVVAVSSPLAAGLIQANIFNSKPAHDLLCEFPVEVHFVLSNRQNNTPELHAICQHAICLLMTPNMGTTRTPMMGWKSDASFTNCVPSLLKFFMNTSRVTLMDMDKFPLKACYSILCVGDIFVYQLALLYRFEHNQASYVGLKAFLKAG